MKKKNILTILVLTLAMVISMAVSASAESQTVSGNCYFNEEGDEVVCDFSSDEFIKSISNLEPGDDVTFKVKFWNEYDGTTHWYMRNEVLKTLEESYDRTQNGGYTYKLVHVRPDGARQTLFDNSEVGGDAVVEGMEGLHQATNATEDWFYIQDLEKGSASDNYCYTELYVKYDGETEVNDYMDTYSALMVAYAVELEDQDTTTTKTTTSVDSGDQTNILIPVAAMIGALLLLILAAISYRKDRKERG